MVEIRIYDTLRGEVVPLVPISPPRVSMFVCGMTPYKPSHIGHGRMAVIYDVVARFLRHQGLRLFYLQNVTDIDDKILRAATEEGRDWKDVSESNFKLYLKSVERLNVHSVNLYAHCTDYIPEILEQVKTLIDTGHAYEAEGDVYFDVSSFPKFGKLSGQRLEMLEAGSRVEPNPKKRKPEDFALWKGEKLGPRWKSPWGDGRPGWHIEDTAIAVNVLGPTYDIHGGGLELKFPHHEAEIAQAESATGKSPLAAIWIHHNMLNMRGEKMSKSLGNVLELDEALRMVDPEVLRFYFLSAHYRSPLDYLGEESLIEAGRSYAGLKSAYENLTALVVERLGPAFPISLKGPNGADRRVHSAGEWIEEATRILPRDPAQYPGDAVEGEMIRFLADDFKAREATAALFGWVGEVNSATSHGLGDRPWEEIASMLRPFLFARDVLGYFFGLGVGREGAQLGGVVEVALACRASAKARKDFAEADRIRQGLLDAGIVVEDSATGAKWKPKR